MFWVYVVAALVIFCAGFMVGGSKMAGEFKADIEALRERAEAAEKSLSAYRNGATNAKPAAKSPGKSA